MADIEYQRLAVGEITEREKQFRAVAVTAFVVNLAYFIGYAYFWIFSVINDEGVSTSVTQDLLTILGIVLLGNGLFGKQFRKLSINIYLCLFELLSIVFYTITFLCLTIGYTFFRDLMEKEIISHHWSYNATTIMVFAILWCLFSDLYHIFAAFCINEYKKLRAIREAEF